MLIGEQVGVRFTRSLSRQKRRMRSSGVCSIGTYPTEVRATAPFTSRCRPHECPPRVPLTLAAAGAWVSAHCPYCAFPCGMLMGEDLGGERPRVDRRPELPGEQRTALHQGLDIGHAARPPVAREDAITTRRWRVACDELG